MKKHKSFTLIEILIVIAIIGILAAVVLALLGGAVRKKAHDAKEITQLKQISTAIEMYKQFNDTYPLPTEWGGPAMWPSCPAGELCPKVDCSSSQPCRQFESLQTYLNIPTSSVLKIMGYDPVETSVDPRCWNGVFGENEYDDFNFSFCYFLRYKTTGGVHQAVDWVIVSKLHNQQMMESDGGVDNNFYEVGSKPVFNWPSYVSGMGWYPPGLGD